MSEADLLRRKLEREQRARQEAERIAEAKTRELWQINQQLRQLTQELEQRVQVRTQELEAALATLQAQEAEARKLSNVASRTDNMVIISDANGDIEWVNHAFEQLTGWTLAEVIGRRPGHFLQGPNTDPATVDFMRAQIHARQGFTSEVINYTRSGREYWVAIEVQPVYDEEGRLANFIAIESDITERRLAEQAMATARDQAMEASRLKSEFLATMSHEIRTPMNGIIGMSELLLDTGLDEEQREFGTIVLTEAQHLLAIINDILDFSKIEAERVTLDSHSFQLLPLVERLIEAMSLKAHERGTDLMAYVDPRIPGQLKGDSGRLRQVLANLVGNAIKFTSDGSVVVSVTLQALTSDVAQIGFEVSDTGIGMSAEVLDRIRAFRPFTQADSSITRKYGGTGLGLPICHGLVELMGGDLTLDSQEGAGTQVSFAIPLTVIQAPLAPEADRYQGSPRHLQLLIVDDNPIHLEILQRTVASWGVDSETASSGAEALELLRLRAGTTRPVHLMITDLVMPGMDGTDLALSIRQDPRIAALPIILLTAYDVQIPADRLRACNFTQTLAKPVRQSQLFDAIADAATSIEPAAIDPPSEKSASDSIPTESPPQGPLVLVAEDNRTNQLVAKRQLQRLGFASVIVDNGAQAVLAMEQRSGPFALILMDVQMPVMDGLEATRQIRRVEGPRGTRIPIIAMTAQALKGDRERCLEAGMDDYISKPVQLVKLRDVLERWADTS